MAAKISVVMPTYNRANLIANAIRSIIDQTFTDWELIIVDDGSYDGTARIVSNFANPKIKYHKVEHCGIITKLRNLGNSLAEGELIVVQDSDDQSFPNRLKEIWGMYQLTKSDVFYHSFYQRFYDPYNGCIVRACKPAMPYSKDELLKSQYIPGQIAYTKKVALEIPYDENVIIADDYVLLLDLALNNKSFERIEAYLYDYVESADSVNIEGEADGRRQKDVQYIIKKLKEKYGIEAGIR